MPKAGQASTERANKTYTTSFEAYFIINMNNTVKSIAIGIAKTNIGQIFCSTMILAAKLD